MKTSERKFPSVLRGFVLFLLALALRAPSAAAQERALGENFDSEELAVATQSSGGAFGLEKSANEFGVWGGGSLDSPTLIGKFEAARLGLLGVRYARVLARGENVTLKYTSDAVPVAVLSFPVLSTPGLRRTVYGAGLSPVGFQVNFRRRERVAALRAGERGLPLLRRAHPGRFGRAVQLHRRLRRRRAGQDGRAARVDGRLQVSPHLERLPRHRQPRLRLEPLLRGVLFLQVSAGGTNKNG